MRTALSTSEAAWLLELDPRSFPRMARRHGVRPVGTVRVGRSTVTRWSVEDVERLAPVPAFDTPNPLAG